MQQLLVVAPFEYENANRRLLLRALSESYTIRTNYLYFNIDVGTCSKILVSRNHDIIRKKRNDYFIDTYKLIILNIK